jgi:nitrous oxidase accessory protein NosD
VKTAPYNGKGDGVTDDTTPIQTAINDASTVGGIVYLPGGTWMFRYLSVTNNNCAIQGAGKDITILKSISGPDSNKTLISLTNAPSSAIRDLTIDSSAATAGSNYALLLYTSSFSEVANVHVLSAYNIGIGFTSCQSLRIHHSVVENSRNGVGILTNTSDCSGTTISYCSILNSAQSGIQILQSAETVDHCYISGAGPTGTSFAGVYVAQGARRCTVSNNIINSCNSGIDVSWGVVSGSGGGPDNSEGIIVTGNNCSNNRGVGISTASNGTIIADNICMDNGSASKLDGSGIGVTTAKNVLIRGNVVGNSLGVSLQKYGILFHSVNGDPANNTVLGNDLIGNAILPIGAEDGAGQLIALPPGQIFAHNLGLDNGIRKYATNYTITSADQGATFANIGAGGTVTFTLPSAEEGLTYTFAVYPSLLMTITAASGDTIWMPNSFSTSIHNATNGSIITLKAISTSRWYTVAHEGTWSF